MNHIGDRNFCDDFMQGQKDCAAGIPHDSAKSDAYTRGYSTEYERQQIMEYRNDNRALRII